MEVVACSCSAASGVYGSINLETAFGSFSLMGDV